MKRQTVAEALQMHSRQLRLTRAANKREVVEMREMLAQLEGFLVRLEALYGKRRSAPRAQA